MVLFVEWLGCGVCDLCYVYESDGYSGNDLMIFVLYFFEGWWIIVWVMVKVLWLLIWVVLDNGKLLVMIYKCEYQVWVWIEMEIDGLVESVVCVLENSIDVIYIIVWCMVGGVQWCYVE